MSFLDDGHPATWDERRWIAAFQAAIQKGSGFHELRAEVFRHTVEIVRSRRYRVDRHDVALYERPPSAPRAVLYAKPAKLTPPPDHAEADTTACCVLNADCVEAAQVLLLAGLRPAVLNMANRHTPGGGVIGGAGAQEENLFRRSDLFVHLFPFADICRQYGLERDPSQSYPLDRNTGGGYSPGVTFFRASERNGYRLIERSFQVDVVTVPAINGPQLIDDEGELRIAEHLVEPTREKIRTILRIAGRHGNDSLVLGAFGCGAFHNPPGHVAQLFSEVFREPEFQSRFGLIVFAIIGDHNVGKHHNPEGNVLPFLRVFDRRD